MTILPIIFMTLIYFIITKGQQYKVNHTKMMADVVMLFALLDDLYTVEFNFVQEDYGYGGVPITREEAGKVLDADIEALGETKEIFLSEMPEKIADLQCLTKVTLRSDSISSSEPDNKALYMIFGFVL